MHSPKVKKQKNGATVLYQKNKLNKATAILIFFKVGSQYDGQKLGICHFVEHLLLNETKTKSNATVRAEHKKLSSDMNGSTWFDYIDFSLYTANDNFEPALKLLGEQIFDPGISQKTFETEREVVYKEIKMRDANDFYQAHIAAIKAMRPKSCFATNPVLGNIQTLSKLTPDDVFDFAKNNLVLPNLIVSVVGALKYCKAKKLVNKYIFDKINDRTKMPKKLNTDYSAAEKSTVEHKKTDRENTHVHFVFPLDCNNDINTFFQARACRYLLEDLGGILLNILREEHGLVYSAWPDFNINDEKYFAIMIQTNAENVNKLFPIMQKVFSKLNMDEVMLKQYKDNYKIKKDKKNYDGHPNKASTHAQQYVKHGKIFSERDYDKALAALTVDDVNAFIKKIREQKKVFVSIVGNIAKKDIMPISEIEKYIFKEV